MIDCQALQGEFDQAMDNHARSTEDSNRAINLSYAKAAENRKQAIGCDK